MISLLGALLVILLLAHKIIWKWFSKAEFDLASSPDLSRVEPLLLPERPRIIRPVRTEILDVPLYWYASVPHLVRDDPTRDQIDVWIRNLATVNLSRMRIDSQEVKPSVSVVRTSYSERTLCPYCRDPFSGDVFYCSFCASVVHPSCFSEFGQCPSCKRSKKIQLTDPIKE